jgi:hypothetical protein
MRGSRNRRTVVQASLGVKQDTILKIMNIITGWWSE